jgi:RNA polymerase sigma-70 factor (ECF subfamily)
MSELEYTESERDAELEFQEIYERFHLRVYRYLSRLVGEYEAEDLTQEVFIKISRGLSEFRGESQLSTWIYRITFNAAMDRRRSPSFYRIRQDNSLNNTIDGRAIEVEDKNIWTGKKTLSVEEQVIRDEMVECYLGFVDRLPPIYRSVYVLGEINGRTNKDIAEILGITLETVKIRLHRARSMLREELQTSCSTYYNEHNDLMCEPRCNCK